MPETLPIDSVGLVTPQTLHFDQPLTLQCGKVLPEYDLVYETYGELNSTASNAILICHALSGHHHAAGYHSASEKKPGWWDSCIGPGKPIDTSRFFVVSLNNLGGCHGSTGPTSINPLTNTQYGPDFPVVTVKDWIISQARLADKLGITTWAAVIGGSLGGMQALQWSIDYPERIKNAVIIASTPKLTAQNIAFNEVARKAITSDPAFHDGRYFEHDTIPQKGLMLARMVGHITYLSDAAMGEKFGRDMRNKAFKFGYDVEFEVESYLNYQGERFSENFDANTYLLMTRALDYFDPAKEYDGLLENALKKALCKFMVISFSTDWRFSPERSEILVDELIKADKHVSYTEIDAPHGHDAFLIPTPRYMDVFSAFMNRVAKEI
ncbi:homoserine O-succinyltransferase MetX [Alkalimarinus alittae]|uniref:Homoserine O-succinyltransferase n=1 Tax=Alkalimarinus alittae TaxID=2961619 RepID=A0ABY6N1I5_9ALTE|nr:homoserine O-acetyltransferase [Alkalimarinus alittae]UZE95943.1 homoserine O-acetyltransferase [Alkalimarinus alittae]